MITWWVVTVFCCLLPFRAPSIAVFYACPLLPTAWCPYPFGCACLPFARRTRGLATRCVPGVDALHACGRAAVAATRALRTARALRAAGSCVACAAKLPLLNGRRLEHRVVVIDGGQMASLFIMASSWRNARHHMFFARAADVAVLNCRTVWHVLPLPLIVDHCVFHFAYQFVTWPSGGDNCSPSLRVLHRHTVDAAEFGDLPFAGFGLTAFAVGRLDEWCTLTLSGRRCYICTVLRRLRLISISVLGFGMILPHCPRCP
jgi:hypothetical protein